MKPEYTVFAVGNGDLLLVDVKGDDVFVSLEFSPWPEASSTESPFGVASQTGRVT